MVINDSDHSLDFRETSTSSTTTTVETTTEEQLVSSTVEIVTQQSSQPVTTRPIGNPLAQTLVFIRISLQLFFVLLGCISVHNYLFILTTSNTIFLAFCGIELVQTVLALQHPCVVVK